MSQIFKEKLSKKIVWKSEMKNAGNFRKVNIKI